MQSQQDRLNRPHLCIQTQLTEDLITEELQFPNLQGLNHNMSMVKKYSINTASSNIDEQQEENSNKIKYTPEQLQLTSVELLEKENQCKIYETKGIYPTSFNLISIAKKKQNVSLKQLMEFNFSVLSYPINDLIKFTTQIIYTNSYAKEIFKRQQLEELVHTIACNYNKVSYHNYSHAFSLMQLNFQCLQTMPKFKSHFTDQQIFYTFISGISHDLNHNGTNNMFEVKRKTDLALLYHNQSVLQNMHIATLWKILQKNPKINFLKKTENKNQAKKTITKLILSTDMTSHFKNLQCLQKRRKQNDVDLNNSQDRMFMMEQIFHSCDLGNPTLEYDSYISWASLLSHEFNQQANLQKAYQVEVTKSFEYKNFSTLYNDQVWFVGKIVYPLWKELTNHLPELSVLKRRIQQNTERLNQKLTEEQLKVRS